MRHRFANTLRWYNDLVNRTNHYVDETLGKTRFTMDINGEPQRKDLHGENQNQEFNQRGIEGSSVTDRNVVMIRQVIIRGTLT